MNNKLNKILEANRPAHYDMQDKPTRAGVSKLHNKNGVPEVQMHKPLPKVKREPIVDGRFKMPTSRAEEFENLTESFEEDTFEAPEEERAKYVVFYDGQVLFESVSLPEALAEIQRLVMSEKTTLNELHLYKKLDLFFGVHVVGDND
jgi:hypothetical protein